MSDESVNIQLLGLAMRAGKIVSGDFAVLSALRKGHVHLLIISNDASGNTKKKWENKAHTYSTPIRYCCTRKILGNAIGKAERVAVGVIDRGFAEKLQGGS